MSTTHQPRPPQIVVDCRGHLLGRLASVLAKVRMTWSGKVRWKKWMTGVTRWETSILLLLFFVIIIIIIIIFLNTINYCYSYAYCLPFLIIIIIGIFVYILYICILLLLSTLLF